MSATVELTKELISRASVTPDDKGCQPLMAERLKAIGFHIESLRFGDVDNLWAVRGDSGPIFCFAGHTDVVPEGDLSQWDSHPYQPEIREGILYGRGAADMKASLAAMVTACERFIANHPNHHGRIAFLITSDEEGPAINGTVKVMEWLEQNNERITWCLVGEPSSTSKLGDIVKNGRRGSLNGKLKIQGKQGHVAYPHLAENPILRSAQAFADLSEEVWDTGNEHFPPTSFQVSNIHSGAGVTNVIPGTLEALFNFRFSTALTAEQLIERTEAIFDRYELNYHIDWTLSGKPFLTPAGKLVDAIAFASESTLGYRSELSTAGGTSDGRFIAPSGAEVVELGPINATIHQVNESVNVADLEPLSAMYEQVMVYLLTESANS